MEAAADDEAAAAGTGRRVGRTVDVDADGDGDEDEEEEAVETTKGAVAAVRAAAAAVMGTSVGVCSIEAEAMDSLARHRSSGYVAALKQSQYQQNRDDEHTRDTHTYRESVECRMHVGGPEDGMDSLTEQMPAKAPATNRVGVSSGRAPSLENSCDDHTSTHRQTSSTQYYPEPDRRTFFSISYEVNWTAEYGMMRTQFCSKFSSSFSSTQR